MADRRKNNSEFWHRRNLPMCLGCFPCPHLRTCGGITIERSVNDCFDFCECKSRSNCAFVCPLNPKNFVARFREVGGFELNDLARSPTMAWPSLPLLVPILPNGYSRSTRLNAPAVAVPLNKLFGAKTGKPAHSDREELAQHFSFLADAKLVVSGVGYDQHLENYWSAARGADFPQHLAQLNPALVTTPNFSLFSDVPRTDDQYNMKRIAICWQELAALGLPTALHVNARTDYDWRRWAQFLKAHPEVGGVAFEFRTGGAPPRRGAWYRDRLIELSQIVGRKLGLVLRGGLLFLRDLARCFCITFLSHSPVIRALRRRKLVWKPGTKDAWQRTPVPNGSALDRLVVHNIHVYGAMVQALVGGHVNNN